MHWWASIHQNEAFWQRCSRLVQSRRRRRGVGFFADTLAIELISQVRINNISTVNATYLNGKEVGPSGITLKNMDVFQISERKFRYECLEVSGAAACVSARIRRWDLTPNRRQLRGATTGLLTPHSFSARFPASLWTKLR